MQLNKGDWSWVTAVKSHPKEGILHLVQKSKSFDFFGHKTNSM